MGLFKKEKKLFEHDPKELDLDMLSHLQASLVAKLVLVNEELISRYKNITHLGSDLPNSSGARSVLTDSANHLDKINELLQSELARITGNVR